MTFDSHSDNHGQEMKLEFFQRLQAKLRTCSGFALLPRRDYLRFPTFSRTCSKLVDVGSALLRRRGWIPNGPNGPELFAGLEQITQRLVDYEHCYAQFHDDASRELFVELLAYRLLGPNFVRLTIDSPKYWDDYYTVNRRFRIASNVGAHGRWRFHQFRVEGRDGDLNLVCHPLNILSTFVLQQYRLERPGFVVEPKPGYCVLDGGACYGDTALWFADRVGPDGRVIAFECDPANREWTESNFARNPLLAKRIDLQNFALWNESDVDLGLDSAGPGSVVGSTSNSTVTVRTVSIDDLSRRTDIHKLDFIKMDIEGAELPALQGGRSTIIRDRPDLAIAAYHRPHDIVDICQFVEQLQVGYKFGLGHFTNHAEETIVFATARSSSVEKGSLGGCNPRSAHIM